MENGAFARFGANAPFYMIFSMENEAFPPFGTNIPFFIIFSKTYYFKGAKMRYYGHIRDNPHMGLMVTQICGKSTSMND